MASANQSDAARASFLRETANDRFKRGFGAWFWGGIIFATLVHFALLRFFPQLRAADFSFAPSELEAIELPPEIEVPPPPETLQRPALPVVAETELDEEVTIAPTTFEENPVDRLPAPPADAADRLSDEPVFTPYTVAPELKDPREAARIVQQRYPQLLQEAGVGGTVIVWAFIDTNGRVRNTAIDTSSGNALLDQAAESAIRSFEFTPALHREGRVPVWVALPITFQPEPA